ncbi:hypothetical protein F383_30058 [Gossypium arboreum]|uniref:Uncharacterized protein n=1 Tax=Gossypium arboreum TaxID=29729 RepID=A0A0B0PJZ8_GOSAR|nr:hypothetical protein F383_30058 [Gossypium arboreum]
MKSGSDKTGQIWSFYGLYSIPVTQ